MSVFRLCTRAFVARRPGYYNIYVYIRAYTFYFRSIFAADLPGARRRIGGHVRIFIYTRGPDVELSSKIPMYTHADTMRYRCIMHSSYTQRR